MTELLEAMNATKRVRKSRIEVVFYGKSVKFPIHFGGSVPMEKVFKKISAIEESRELSRTSSNEDLNRQHAAASVSQSQELPRTTKI